MKLVLLLVVCFAVACEARRDIRCLQAVETGKCRASIDRWAYFPKENRCKMFTYGGCGGTGNNFKTEAECMRVCVM
ncbi:Kunitz/Bovine pancreatic trypsin inhibitor domain protein [Ancylostoma caninum]|uniref:Kunitz/Bovine pancreatic trypsin inhibitor domain protein n=1 Tax=Ancylostoma caninum TaxID=29170 RepID=A0A368GWZ8_ANCCA|nr:Kunitz/Bovine pancreatic trypsin inhibitor domain protein [Ancylostoma caninum]